LRKALMGLLVLVVFVGALVVGIFSMIGRADAVTLAMEQARANDQVKERLGEPLEKGLFVTGNINVSGGSGDAQLSIPVSGPKGKGTLYIVAKKSMGLWKAQALQLAGEKDSYRIDLLQGNGNQSNSGGR
jgi:hypothetical protein